MLHTCTAHVLCKHSREVPQHAWVRRLWLLPWLSAVDGAGRSHVATAPDLRAQQLIRHHLVGHAVRYKVFVLRKRSRVYDGLCGSNSALSFFISAVFAPLLIDLTSQHNGPTLKLHLKWEAL